jgi:hypothetical protein
MEDSMKNKLSKSEWTELRKKKSKVKADKAAEKSQPCDFIPKVDGYTADMDTASRMIFSAFQKSRINRQRRMKHGS